MLVIVRKKERDDAKILSRTDTQTTDEPHTQQLLFSAAFRMSFSSLFPTTVMTL